MLLPDWSTSSVTLVLPTAAMYVYNEHLAALELFYADLLRELCKYEERVTCLVPDPAHAEKMARLSGAPLEVFRVASLPDVWIRDFAPLPMHDGYVKFVYNPLYSRKKFNRQVDAALLAHLAEQGLAVRSSPIVLEGGNLVHNGAGIGIATEKIYALNRGRSRADLVRELCETLELEELVVVPCEPEDRTGHVDGMLRWVAENELVVNDYGAVGLGAHPFGRKLARVLEQRLSGVLRTGIPYRYSDDKLNGWYDVRGNYTNFLMTRNRVYVPVYGLVEDERVAALFEERFPGRVSYVDSGVISRFGGALNCITWNHA